MIKKTIPFLLLFFTLTLYAQEEDPINNERKLHLGFDIAGGLSGGYIINEEEIIPITFVVPFGIRLGYNISDKFIIGSGVNFYLKNYKPRKGYIYSDCDSCYTGDFIEFNNNKHFDIPLFLQYNLVKYDDNTTVIPYALLGLTYSLIYQDWKFVEGKDEINSNVIEHQYYYNDLSFNIGVGLMFYISQKTAISITMKYRKSFIYYSHYMFGLGLGFNYEF